MEGNRWLFSGRPSVRPWATSAGTISRMAYKMRCGKGYELAVLGLLTLADFDVYAPLVDDQGIDGIIRVRGKRTARYFDLQIKGSKNWGKIRCKVAALPVNGVLILFCDGCKELLWFLHDEATKVFPP